MSIIKEENQRKHLPISKHDLKSRGWKCCDFIVVSGDAYVDHPSFGAALIARLLEAEGYKIGIIPQPDWKNPDSFKVLGKPLAFLITSGNLDSMVNHYTSTKKRRRVDSYSPGGKTGLRPDRALIAYTSTARQAYKGVPVVVGGIEASLRRLSHYDYWSNKLRRSILVDSKADLLVYGMGERAIIEIAKRIAQGQHPGAFYDIPGIVFRVGTKSENFIYKNSEITFLPSYSEILSDKHLFAESFVIRYNNTNPFTAKVLAEKTDSQLVVQNPPAKPLSTDELDRIYSLPYTKKAHPIYNLEGGVPALKEVEFSLTVNRGCFGGCSFCSLTFHQGKIVQARSESSVVKEAEEMINGPDFKGVIHDVGGPTANFHHSSCKKQQERGSCSNRECLFPSACKNIDTDHTKYLSLLRKLRALKGVKHIFIRSGIRFDYLMEAIKRGGETGGRDFLNELCQYHISGQLKIAPEHISERVLSIMKKPSNRVYREFVEEFTKTNKVFGKKQYLIPYLISGHPGSTLEDAINLALYLKKQGFIPDQVQDFYPTPASLSTCIYYSEIDPFTKEDVYVPKDPEEKAMQRALLHFHKIENKRLVVKALKKAGRTDLIGFGKKCLIK